ncbi:MAG: TlpA family protein disulfide reductase [Rhodothermales bacterium]|nr:TlpA family protein disulfide reductase [Rhodothermales bacterium]MBO6780504.1 TlpA family protein disulfide reductase [Rhodothermales bacterium]
MEKREKQPWWKNGWLWGLLVIGVLHLTGMAVHVQAGMQRVLLETGLFHPDIRPSEERAAAPTGLVVRTADGQAHRLEDFEGQVRFINFWATWCAPCLAEMPAISRLHRDYGERVRFLMVNLDEDPGVAREYLERSDFGLELVRPIGPIPQGLSTGLIPTTVVVDREGRIAVHEGGMADYDSRRFRTGLDKLLEEAGP